MTKLSTIAAVTLLVLGVSALSFVPGTTVSADNNEATGLDSTAKDGEINQVDGGPIGVGDPECSPGYTGAPGVTGPQGPVGPTGAFGAQGQQGPAGFTGVRGPTGPMGVRGPTGPTGPTGATGPLGPPVPASAICGSAFYQSPVCTGGYSSTSVCNSLCGGSDRVIGKGQGPCYATSDDGVCYANACSISNRGICCICEPDR